jgi:N-acetylmuramoyl-L-alanine amidase
VPLQAQQVAVNGLRMWTAPDHTRLVFDTSNDVEHSVFTLMEPMRLVIDLKSASPRFTTPELNPKDPLISAIRTGARNQGKDVRVVLDLKIPVRPKSFVLKPNPQYGHRLVVDLYDAVQAGLTQVVKKTIEQARSRDVVVAIDAGHGGEDPGARGPKGVYEKDVVLAIARKLAKLVEQEPGMRPALIRDGDYYVPLRARMDKAHDARADLFVSIHADAFRDRRVRGSSVFTLSERGASSEAARWLADSENASDLIGGVTLDDKGDVLRSVLLDLSQTATLEASNNLAQEMLNELHSTGKVHKRDVQSAGFVVLKSPDIPSVLVETAFISNPQEEKKLSHPVHQQRLAEALMNGIRDYFDRYPPPGTLLAENQAQEHVISRGDTLSTIAKRYRVSLNSLMEANGLSGDRIRPGQVLRIPGG